MARLGTNLILGLVPLLQIPVPQDHLKESTGTVSEGYEGHTMAPDRFTTPYYGFQQLFYTVL